MWVLEPKALPFQNIRDFFVLLSTQYRSKLFTALMDVLDEEVFVEQDLL